MSLWTQVRDTVVQATVPKSVQDQFNQAQSSGTLASLATSTAISGGVELVKMATAEPTGNLNAAQIASGQTGTPPPSMGGGSSGMVSVAGMSLTLPILISVGFLAYMVLRKR